MCQNTRKGCCCEHNVSTKNIILLLLVWTSSAVLRVVASTHDGPLEFEDILPEDPREYDKMAPPREVGQPTIVYFHVTVMSLDSIDENSMTYAADIFFAQSWKDGRLRLPDNMTHEYRLLPVTWLNEIWRPDSFFKNAKDVTFQDMTIPNHYIWLYQDKTILYMVKLTLVLSCAMNFEVYPHDTQECTMKIESLSHTTADLVFVWDPEVPLVVDTAIELPQLDLVNNITGDCTQVYSTGNFTCLEVVFTLRRRLGYYLFHTYIPTCLIVIMSWISFWIRPEAVPARVTLGVTSLLTLATQHANSQKALPPVSYIKAIDMFMSSCMVFVFFSLMEYAVVNIVLGDIPDDKKKKGMFFHDEDGQLVKAPSRATECLGLGLGLSAGLGISLGIGAGGCGDGDDSDEEDCTSHHCSCKNPELSPTHSAGTESRFNKSKFTEDQVLCSIHAPLNGLPLNNTQEKYPQHLHPLLQGQPLMGSTPQLNRASPEPIPRIGSTSQLNTIHSCNQTNYVSRLQPGNPNKTTNYKPPHLKIDTRANKERNLPSPPPPPNSANCKQTAMIMKKKRECAILIDRISRVLFPLSFTILNLIYWGVFVIDWSAFSTF